MDLNTKRYSDNKESTLGLFFINGNFKCYTLEDEKRTVKVFGETRITEGTYEVVFRTEGGHHNRYLERYGSEFHKGMLHVTNVPNFEYILIHVGNKDDDTAGCLLTGDKANNNTIEAGFISSSRAAYERIYPIIRDALLRGEKVFITYEDISGHA